MNQSSDQFEDRLKQLETLVAKLEQGQLLPLQESIDLFREGVAAAKHCHQYLQEAQLVVEQLDLNTDSDSKTAADD